MSRAKEEDEECFVESGKELERSKRGLNRHFLDRPEKGIRNLLFREVVEVDWSISVVSWS